MTFDHFYSEKFLDRLSEICADVGQICIGSIIIPFLFENFDWWSVITGSATAGIFWSLSLWLTKEKT